MADTPTNPPYGGQYKSKVSQGDLPWALVMMPTTSSGQSGIGNNKHGLMPESWVVGFFADGDDCQQPIIIGTLPGGPGPGSYVQAIGQGLTAAGEIITNVVTGIIENLTGTNVEKGMTFLIKNGYTAEQSAGILGCLQVESGPNLNTKAFNPAGGGKGAFGIAQWRGERQASLRAFAERTAGGDVESLEVQLAYIVKELKEAPQYSGSKTEQMLQNARSPQDAAIAFAHYERGEDFSAQAFKETGNGCTFDPKYDNNKEILKKRIDNATRIFQSFSNNNNTSSPPAQ